jgi:hypothetical protein
MVRVGAPKLGSGVENMESVKPLGGQLGRRKQRKLEEQ